MKFLSVTSSAPIRAAFAAAALLILSTSAAQAAAPSAFDRILDPYEAVRTALTEDHTRGVAEQAEEIRTVLADLAKNPTAAKAGVPAARVDEVKALLPELTQAARALSEATTLGAARKAFYELSKPLIRYRSLVSGERPVVAYCPMAKRSWLQSEGDLGNPYHGAAMLTCGEVVDG